MTLSAAQQRSLRRPGKLYRVLTSYVGTRVNPSHPTPSVVDKPCRWGRMVGFALVNEQFGYQAGGYRELEGFHVNRPMDPLRGGEIADGNTPVSFQMNEWICEIYNAGDQPAPAGSLVYYSDAAVGPAADRNYHLVTNDDPTALTSDYDAFAGVTKVAIPAMTLDKGAILLLLNSPAIDLKSPGSDF